MNCPICHGPVYLGIFRSGYGEALEKKFSCYACRQAFTAEDTFANPCPNCMMELDKFEMDDASRWEGCRECGEVRLLEEKPILSTR